MKLAQKLERLKAQQAAVEQKMADEIARQDAVALSVFEKFISGQQAALNSLLNSKHAQSLGKRDRTLLTQWASRIAPDLTPAQAHTTAPEVVVGQTQGVVGHKPSFNS